MAHLLFAGLQFATPIVALAEVGETQPCALDAWGRPAICVPREEIEKEIAGQPSDKCTYPTPNGGCSGDGCEAGTYRTKEGECVSRPAKATAHCHDGTWEYGGTPWDEHACASHDGVERYVKKDGTMSALVPYEVKDRP